MSRILGSARARVGRSGARVLALGVGSRVFVGVARGVTRGEAPPNKRHSKGTLLENTLLSCSSVLLLLSDSEEYLQELAVLIRGFVFEKTGPSRSSAKPGISRAPVLQAPSSASLPLSQTLKTFSETAGSSGGGEGKMIFGRRVGCDGVAAAKERAAMRRGP